MSRIRILIWKEFMHLRNDPVGIRLMVIPIIFQVFILGYAITTEVRNTPVTVCDRSNTPQSRSMVESISRNRMFVFSGISRTENEIRRRLDSGNSKIGIIIPEDFANKIEQNSEADIALILDGQDANSSGVAGGYIGAIVTGWMMNFYKRKLAAMGLSIKEIIPVEIRPKILFNPLLKSTWYMVPAMAVLLVTMVTALLTGFSIVREKEAGTLEQLFVTPIKPFQLVVGKSVPFMVIGLVEMTTIFIIAQIWFQIPFRGSYFTLILFTFIYMFSSIGIGIFTSTVSRTPHQALFMTWFILLFFVLLSGFFLPLENMPFWVQNMTVVNPVRHFIVVVREVFLKGAGLHDLWMEGGAMIAIGITVYIFALLTFKRRMS